MWQDYQASPSRTNFYRDRLSTLFFDGLNNTQSQNLSSRVRHLIGEVPFLNGGLFEETDLDRRAVNAVPDEAVAPLLTDLFNRYNFTVMKATPIDTEVAVDPEMLGKLFEETVNERHSNGAYYTPRPVVSFMCREAIKGYLNGKGITNLDDAKIADLVDRRNPDAITPMQAPEIYEAVKNMKAVDPACGSGAFLLGMLQEILALNESLFRAGHTAESLYQQKLDIITNNIYGADKDALAVSTAMLRLWLSLAVDYDGDDPPKPLPNLDLKLMFGDAIAGPDPQQFDFTRDIIAKSSLRDDIAAYTTAYGQQKDTLKQQVDDTKAQLRSSLKGAAPFGVVEWRIDFADVVLNGGFDVVIANPPYVQLQRNHGELANLYQNAGYATFARTGDIYQLFYERGFQLLKSDGGLLAYISSNSWLRAEYGKTTRRYFAERHTPLYLLDLGKDVFESAIVDSCVLIARAGQHDVIARGVDLDKAATPDFPPEVSLWSELRPNGESPWTILTPTEQGVMHKMLTTGTPLRDWDLNINYGIKTGCNKAFLIEDATRQALIEADAKSEEIIKPVLRGQDLRRYYTEASGWHLIDTHNGYGDVAAVSVDDYPAVKAHLNKFYPHLAQRQDKGRTPYNLRNCAYHEEFEREKLFWMDLTQRGRFSYADKDTYGVNTVYMLSGEAMKYLSGVLNSALITWFMNNVAVTSGMGVTRWFSTTVERIPVPKISAAQQRPFIQLVDCILAAKASDPAADATALQAEIDQLVYELYALTEPEIKAVEQP